MKKEDFIDFKEDGHASLVGGEAGKGNSAEIKVFVGTRPASQLRIVGSF